MLAAPANILSISIPKNAAGTRPTGLITENLPPIDASIGKVFRLFWVAYSLKGPLFGSVTTTICFFKSCTFDLNHSWIKE